MAVNCMAKTLFIVEYEKLFTLVFKLLEYDPNKCHNFALRLKNQIHIIVRHEYVRNKFADRDEMYLFAISEIKTYYQNPYRLIFQYLN
jgi:hypothetical protein